MTRRLTLAVLGLFLSCAARGEQFYDAGDFHVHYSAVSTAMLSPEVATANGITRSRNRAMLNVAVLRVTEGGTEPVSATVTAMATNRSGQQREMNIRAVREPGAIYYVGFTRISNEEQLTFDLKVQPENAERAYRIRFDQQFFTD